PPVNRYIQRTAHYLRSHILEGKGREASDGFVDMERAQGRRRGALRAQRTLAKPAVDANGGRIQSIKIEPPRIDKALAYLISHPRPTAKRGSIAPYGASARRTVRAIENHCVPSGSSMVCVKILPGSAKAA